MEVTEDKPRFIIGVFNISFIIFLLSIIVARPLEAINPLYTYFTGVETTGQVIGYKEVLHNNKGAKSYRYYPIVKFYVDNKAYEACNYYFWGKDLPVNENILVYYRKNNPEQIMLPYKSYFIGFIFLKRSAFVMIVSALIDWIYRRLKLKKLKSKNKKII